MRFRVCCIESGDDLGPLLVDFGRGHWVGVDGRLTDYLFFIAIFDAFKGAKKNCDTYSCYAPLHTT